MKWKIVPVEATKRMAEIAFNMGGVGVYEELVAAAPPYVVTDEDVYAAWDAFLDQKDDARMRAALEAFVKRLEAGRESP